MIRLPTTSFAACPSLQRPDHEEQLELLEAEQARKLELQEVEMQPVDSQGTLTDWLAQKDLWQASENRLALVQRDNGNRHVIVSCPLGRCGPLSPGCRGGRCRS